MPKKQLPKKLQDLIESKNIADTLDEETLNKISMKVFMGYEEDRQTMSKWLMMVEETQKLASLEREPKNTPRPDAANVKFPLITSACYHLAAKALPEILNGGRPVKGQIYGASNKMLEDKAWRMEEFTNYQLCGVDSTWTHSTDKLLSALYNIGFQVKKTYYDSVKKKNQSYVCHYKDVVLRNGHDIQCLDDLRRITHDLHLHINDLVEGMNYGIYSEKTVKDIITSLGESALDLDEPLLIHEQHRFLDLDKDGYEEPYIVTQDPRTNKILRIVARFDEEDVSLTKEGEVSCIEPIQFFTDFHCLRSSDGSFISQGLGTLMLHLNESINTVLNELIDAGALCNMQTGIIDSRLKLLGGDMLTDPGMWHRVKGVYGQDLEKGIVPIQYKEPSQVLFQLLGLLIQAGQQLVQSTQVMDGTANPQNSPAASVMTLMENGSKLENSIQCRIFESLKSEFQKIFRLNKKYLDPIQEENALGIQISQQDFKSSSIQIVPVSDPQMSSQVQRMAQVQFMMSVLQQPALSSHINAQEVLSRGFDILHIPEPQKLISQQPPQPDPKMIQAQAHAQAQTAKVKLQGRAEDRKDKEFVAKLAKMQADIEHLQAKSLDLITHADKNQKESGVNEFNAHVNALKTQMDSVAQAHQQMTQANQGQQQIGLQQRQQVLDAIQQKHDMMHQNVSAVQNHIGLHQEQQGLGQEQQKIELTKKAQEQPYQEPSDEEQDTGEGQE